MDKKGHTASGLIRPIGAVPSKVADERLIDARAVRHALEIVLTVDA